MSTERQRQPTLSDVARRANVSKQTISRVINNKSEVSEATRQRVLEAIRELGYHPNSLARSLATRKSHVIGLTLPNIDQPFFPQIARGVEDAATADGYSVFLGNASGDPARELQAIERLRGHRVAGIISFNSRLTDDDMERAAGGLFPVLMINRELPNVRGEVIWPGYESGAELATGHLISLNRKRIAFLGLDGDSNVDADKLRGYRSALQKAGAPNHPELVFRAVDHLAKEFSGLIDGGYRSIAAALDCGCGVDAIFASNDLPAIGAMHAIVERGLRVPEDVAVIGFGGSNVAGIVSPTLSTVTMPLYEIGTAAFRALRRRIDGDESCVEGVQSMPELIVRESTDGAAALTSQM